ncbi:glycosyltransferase involved in cell wall biosynthesis [Bacteriovorax stolpii]|nr:glycosyltransferase family 4 protein [Bacteriovorax stolpii]TDP54191.1 glycosyltransferase involved in cell wall biosynthesis [Bacteriovorax stolpii]
MREQTFLIITKEEISFWKSCQLITKNLIQSYQLALKGHNIQFLKVEEDLTPASAYKHALKIKEINPQGLIWVDHEPCSALLLNALNSVLSDKPYNDKPKFFIHLFGDFVLQCRQWETTLKSLNEFPVHFLVASDAQKLLVDKMFISTKNITTVIPFPVEKSVFNASAFSQQRNLMREKFKLKDEVVLLYTGRMSLQKNIDSLVNTFTKVKNLVGGNAELWLAGPWDNILLPYHGTRGLPGSYFSQFKSSLLDKGLSNVRFLGDLDEEELLGVYHASDLFVSFSTFNDDDYGMSIAEALMCGLPALLTQWGGLPTFKKYSEHVDLVPIEFQDVRMHPQSILAQKKMMAKILEIKENKFPREEMASYSANYLSIEAVGKKLEELLFAVDFNAKIEFSQVFYKLSTTFHLSSDAPFKNNLGLYKDVYGDYGTL